MKTGIIITAYCAEPFLNKKLEITEQLCTQLSKLNKPLLGLVSGAP